MIAAGGDRRRPTHCSRLVAGGTIRAPIRHRQAQTKKTLDGSATLRAETRANRARVVFFGRRVAAHDPVSKNGRCNAVRSAPPLGGNGHALFPILPLTGDLQRVMRGGPAYAWDPEKGAHVGVMARDGDNITLELPISLSEAVLGGQIRVPTPTGDVTMSVPKGSNTGTTLRLRGKGAPRRDGGNGDELVKLKVILPKPPDPELEAFVSSWAKGKDFNPREGNRS